MKAIMISIRPEWVAKILNGEKTIEIRKTMPKCELPVEVYIYVSQIGNLKNCLYGLYDDKGNFEYEVADYYSGLEQLNGKVVAKFTLNKVEEIYPYIKWNFESGYEWVYEEKVLKKSCLTDIELGDYIYSKDGKGYAWHIDNLQIFNETKELKDFGLTKAPQSWCYVKADLKSLQNGD